ncbi:MAG: hypothetical protein O6758_10155 [Planctomycetota bacterium]|nr:hypothetical protein [Planctomycetota bacterium]
MHALAAIVLAVTALAEPANANDPFQAAALAPPNVRMYVHVAGAAEIRAAVADRPLARWVKSLLGAGQLRDAWPRLAAAAGIDGGQLFDTCLGRRFTLLLRGRDQPPQWAVLTEVNPQQIAKLLAALTPRVLGPKHKLAILHLPEHELLLAQSGAMLLIGPRPRSELFYEMVSNLTQPPEESLAASEAMAEAGRLGPGSVGVFIRHEPPMGGWSVAVADLKGPHISIQHSARFDHPPFASDVTGFAWDLAPIHRLQDSTILTYIEPIDKSGGPLEAFVTAAMGQAPMTAQMRSNLGSRQITTIGDFSGQLEQPPGDLRLPTVARVYEVKNADQAWDQLDRQMIWLVRELVRFGGDNFRLAVPDPAGFEPGKPRRVEVGPLAKWLFGEVPGVERVSLNWTVVCGPQGTWCIIASDPDHLGDVATALGAEPNGESNIARWANCGTADGRRLAAHLGGWRDQAELLVSPEDVEAFRGALRFFFELADAIERCTWQLARPSTDRLRLDAQLTLSPPDSAHSRHSIGR